MEVFLTHMLLACQQGATAAHIKRGQQEKEPIRKKLYNHCWQLLHAWGHLFSMHCTPDCMHAGAFCARQLGEIEEATYNAMANTKRRLPHFLQFKDTEILDSLTVMSYNNQYNKRQVESCS